MAYKVKDIYNYGSGALGDVLNPTGQINSYANVTAISTDGKTLTIGTPSNGAYETFVVGKTVMFHVSAVASGTSTTYLGNYLFAKITTVSGSNITLDKAVTTALPVANLSTYITQLVTVAQFSTLNLTGSISPLAYSVTNKYGGIIAFQCSTAFNISGTGAVSLTGKGIPIANIALRPATPQETDTNQMGWENHITSRKLYLNCPDGAMFIAAKTTNITGTSVRLGGTAAGIARYPYNTTFANSSSTSVKGGSTIALISETLTGFDPAVISKTSSNTSGSGLGRAYIATESKITADECLYAVDCINKQNRLANLGIKNYGDGSLGTVLSLSGQVNTYANVSAISADGKTLTIGTIYPGVYETFTVGKQVMFHVSRQTGSENIQLGKFILARIVSVSGTSVVLDTPVTNVVTADVISKYKCQIVTVAQFNTLACSASYTGAKAYDDTAGCGGILAMAAKTQIDLSGGILDMADKGIPSSISRPSVPWQSSGIQWDCLPLSQGTGAILLLSKIITINTATRIGTTINGNLYGGNAGNKYTGYGGDGLDGNIGIPCIGGTGACTGAQGGGGGMVGIFGTQGGRSGSWVLGGAPGASIFIIANTINNFNIVSLSTGGFGGSRASAGGTNGANGGAGYGGGGGGCGNYLSGAGGGGGSGTCFIYANNVTNVDYTAYIND